MYTFVFLLGSTETATSQIYQMISTEYLLSVFDGT